MLAFYRRMTVPSDSMLETMPFVCADACSTQVTCDWTSALALQLRL